MAHRVVFRLELALGGLGLAAVAVAVAAAVASVHRDPRTAHAVAVLGAHLTYPEINVAAGLLLALAALGVAVIITVARTGRDQVRAYRRFLADVTVIGPLPGHPDVTVIGDSQPHAFCAGFLRPRVFVSTGALELLDADALEAVVLHERDHLAARDPLRLALARALAQGLFFVPALRSLARQYGELAEARADAAAVAAAGGDRRPLASALLAFDAETLAGGAGISPERVDALLGTGERSRLPSALIATSVVALAGVVVLVWRASGEAAASTTFNLPVVSSQPCMVVLALVPVAVWLVGRMAFRTAGQA